MAAATETLDELAHSLSLLAQPAEQRRISPSNQALRSLARQLGERDGVMQEVARSLSRNASNATFFFNVAEALRNEGQPELAVGNYRRALEIDPQFADAALGLAESLECQGDIPGAIQQYRQALETDGQCETIQCESNPSENTLIQTALSQNTPSQNSQCQKAHRLRSGQAHRQLGRILMEHGECDLAYFHLRSVAQCNPDDPAALAMLGQWFNRMGHVPEAVEQYQQAAALCPGDLDARLLTGELALQQGHWEDGWREFQWRRQARSRNTWRQACPEPGRRACPEPGRRACPEPRRRAPYPIWDGQDLTDTVLLVRSEQNVAMDLLLSCCIPDVLSQTKDCMLECHPKLTGLFSASFPGLKIVRAARGHDSAVSAPDAERPTAQVLLGSLPRWFRRSDADFPAHAGYLKAPADARKRWRKRLDAIGARPKVGLAWHGDRRGENNDVSLSACDWHALLGVKDVHFVDLQFGSDKSETSNKAEVESLSNGGQIRPQRADEMQSTADFEERAALLAELDLLIAVPGVTAHLAGALGVPGMVLVPSMPGWAWGLSGDRTPWYPSLKLFRQSRPGRWDDVATAVTEALREWAGK